MERSDTVSPLSIPSSYQVLHKLKEWDESQNDSNDSDQSAQFQQQLFSMLKSLRHSIPKFTHDPTYDPDLHNESASRVNRFLAASRCYKPEWQEMGFLLPSEGFGSSSSSSSRPRRKEEFGIMQIRSLAAHTTVTILAELGLPCAIFGSMACKLYGNQRIPNDIDILVLPPPERSSITQEEVKALIAQRASPNYHYVLKPSRDPLATYKVLYFVAKPRPPSTAIISPNGTTTNDNDDDDNDNSSVPEFTVPISIPRHSSSKVDILLPGIMHLPALPTCMITRLHSLPLVPFPVLLLQKLQGWADHNAAREARYRLKIGVDSGDLEWCLNWRNVKRYFLLKYASGVDDDDDGSQNKNKKEKKNRKAKKKEKRECLKGLWSDRTMFSEEFEELSRMRVREFCEAYTGLRDAWRAIGFDV